MANINLRDVIRNATYQGWSVERCGNNHYRFLPPDKSKEAVVTSSTPSDHRVIKNFMSRMRRSGYREEVAA